MRSSNVNDIIEKDPSWLIKWGIASILSFLVILLFVSNLIAFPDINMAKVELTTLSPPIPLFARTNGYIKEIFSKDGDTVEKNSILVVIDNNSNLDQLKELSKWIEAGQFESLNKIIKTEIPNFKMLGELQQLHNDLLIIFNEIKQYRKTDIYAMKIKKEIIDLTNDKKLLQIEENKYELIKQDLSILQKDADNNEVLFSKEIISSKDVNGYRRLILQKKIEIESIQSNMVNIELNINLTSGQVLELNDAKEQKETSLLLGFNNKIKELKFAYQNWKDKYLITAQIHGRVAYFKRWESGEYVNVSDQILTIIPLKEREIYATGILPIDNAGKVKIGQKVNIKLDDYPFREFGILNGKLVYISQTQNKGYYSIKVQVDRNIPSFNRKKLLWFKSNMQASAEIITNDVTLFQRLLFKFRNIYTQ